jgi:hypothetical protein
MSASEGDLGAKVRTVAATEGIGVPFVRSILHEEFLYPYNIRRVHHSLPFATMQVRRFPNGFSQNAL